MTNRTLCFLIKRKPVSEVLLGYKKTGFGKGKYLGIGGGVEEGETPEIAAIRELEEETSIQALISDLTFLGTLDFQFPFSTSWNQVVYIFLLEKWFGEEKESVEIRPEWFKTDMIPYDKMWQDASYWLPEILRKRKINATFSFKEDNETVANHEIKIIEEI